MSGVLALDPFHTEGEGWVPLGPDVELSWCPSMGARHSCCGDGVDAWPRHPAVGLRQTTACFLRDAGGELIHNTSYGTLAPRT